MIQWSTAAKVAASSIFTVWWLAASAAVAEPGRVTFLVTTAEGEPVKGVEIQVTSRDEPSFSKVLETNKKGKAVLAILQPGPTFQFLLEHEDYPPIEGEVQPREAEDDTRKLILATAAAVAQAAEVQQAATAGLRPAELRFNEGLAAANSGDYETAKMKFTAAIDKDPNLAPAHQALAGIYFDEKDYEAAVRHATLASELDAEDVRALRILHDAHGKLGNEQESKQALARLEAAGKGGDAAAAIYNQGVAALREGDKQTARNQFEKALALQADLWPVASALAIISYQLGDFGRAAELAESFLTANPADADMLRVRWESYRQLGDEARTETALEALLAVDSSALVVDLFDNAAKLFEAGKTEEAAEAFQRILEIDPDQPRAHYQLGVCMVGLGQNDGAREHFERFIELAPDDPEAATAREMLSYIE